MKLDRPMKASDSSILCHNPSHTLKRNPFRDRVWRNRQHPIRPTIKTEYSGWDMCRCEIAIGIAIGFSYVMSSCLYIHPVQNQPVSIQTHQGTCPILSGSFSVVCNDCLFVCLSCLVCVCVMYVSLICVRVSLFLFLSLSIYFYLCLTQVVGPRLSGLVWCVYICVYVCVWPAPSPSPLHPYLVTFVFIICGVCLVLLERLLHFPPRILLLLSSLRTDLAMLFFSYSSLIIDSSSFFSQFFLHFQPGPSYILLIQILRVVSYI